MSLKINKSGIISASGGTGINENMALQEPLLYAPNGYNTYKINLNKNMVVGNQYTIQFWNVDISHSGKESNLLSVHVYWSGGMNSEIQFYAGLSSGHADYLVGTFTAHNRGAAAETNPVLWLYNSTPNVSGTKYMYIEKWKLEEGSIATPFSYSPADPLYAGIDGFIEDDTLSNGRFLKDIVHTKSIIEI
jgi:hypothetical protein